MTTPDGWIKGRLGSVCSIEIGGTPSRSVEAYWDAEMKTGNAWVSIKDMRTRVLTETAEQISDEGVARSNVKLQAPGTVLLSFKLTIGRVAYAGVPLYTNEAIAGLRPTGLSAEYLYYGLQQWDLLQGVDQAIKGATLNKEKLKRITFEYPADPGEQSKIAEFLSTVDRAIEQTEVLIAKQQRIKNGLMQDLLRRGIDEHGNLRSEETHKFKDSPLGRIPAEWDVRSLAQSSSRLITYGIVQPGTYRVDGVPFVQTKDLVKGVLDPNKMDRTSHEIHSAYQRSAINTGDVLVGIRASVGAVVQVPKALNGANISRGIARVSPSSAIVGRYLFWILQSVDCQNAIALQIKGSTYPEITLPALRAIMIPVPLQAEQKEVAAVLDHAAKEATELDQLLSKIKLVKAGLMQDLLTGQRRVTPLLTEPLEATA